MEIDELIDMDLKGQVGMALTVAVATIVAINLIPAMIAGILNPSTETFSNAIVAAAVNWWVPLVKASPLLFVCMLFLFVWAEVEELLEW
jgi:ABC-type amino acid transport system permease subunit